MSEEFRFLQDQEPDSGTGWGNDAYQSNRNYRGRAEFT